MAGRSVSRILSSACPTSGRRAGVIIPLGPDSRRDSSGLPEGHHASPAEADSAYAGRASPPLLFGLAPRGVCRASGVTTGAVGSYPTFSPLPCTASYWKTGRRFRLRSVAEAWPRRRYLLCGAVRGRFRSLAACKRRANARRYTSRVANGPLALPGALPCGVRTFLQHGRLATPGPAITRPTRQLRLYAGPILTSMRRRSPSSLCPRLKATRSSRSEDPGRRNLRRDPFLP